MRPTSSPPASESAPPPRCRGDRTRDNAPASLELFDLLGRRISKRDVGGLGSGSHTVRLIAAGALGPGIYQVRLTRDGRSLVARVVVTR